MSRKSWHLDRRTFLVGSTFSLALPYLECMGADAVQHATPRRFCGIYFPFGVSLPGAKDKENAKWSWFPRGEGKNFEFNESLKPLQNQRENVTVLGGLSHPNGRRMGGHDTGDTFLTGAFLSGKLHNKVSVDQIAAKALSNKTRFSSLVMSTDGGVGEPTRSSTLSYNEHGRPIPALNQPQQIFDRFFGAGDADSLRKRRRLQAAAGMLDDVLEHSRSLRRQLGSIDRDKLDEYLSSVQQIEKRVRRTQSWLDVPLPSLSDEERKHLKLESDDQAPREFIRTMYDLIYLAFTTDSTRIATYQIASMADASSKAGAFPFREGFKANLHSLAHGWNKPAGAVALGKWDRFMIEQLTYFLDRLRSVEEPGGTVLDHSMIFYGSSNSQTHNNQNYPLVFAGGGALGIQHGQYRKFSKDVPLSNLFVTVLQRLGLNASHFADSTGEMNELCRA